VGQKSRGMLMADAPAVKVDRQVQCMLERSVPGFVVAQTIIS
jgi:hypothetical protein